LASCVGAKANVPFVGRQLFKKNMRWAKNKKHRVGLSVGFPVLSIFRFSVLSQWFTFQFVVVGSVFLHLAVTVWLCVVWDFETINFQFTTNFI